MIWENGIETCIILYVKQIASPGSMHDTGCLGLVHWDDPEGWYGQRLGRGDSGWAIRVYLWQIPVDVWQSENVGLKLNIQKTKIMASGPITSWEIDEETVETVSAFIFWAPKSLQMVVVAMKLQDAYSLEGKYVQPRQHLKKQRHYFANKGLSSQGYGFSCGRVWM